MAMVKDEGKIRRWKMSMVKEHDILIQNHLYGNSSLNKINKIITFITKQNF